MKRAKKAKALIHKELGEYLREYRIKNDLDQAEVAKALGYSSSQFISNFERGLCSPPLPKLKILMKIYNIPLKEMTKTLLSLEEMLITSVLSDGETASKTKGKRSA